MGKKKVITVWQTLSAVVTAPPRFSCLNMQLSLSARYFNLAVNNAWRAVSMQSVEGGMHGWDDSCVTEDRGSAKQSKLENTDWHLCAEWAGCQRRICCECKWSVPKTAVDISGTDSLNVPCVVIERQNKKEVTVFNAEGQRLQLKIQRKVWIAGLQLMLILIKSRFLNLVNEYKK